MSTQEPPPLSEEEMRQLEAELERITVDDVLLQTIVSLVNLGARKAALGAPPEAGITPDWPQVQTAIDAVRALLPIVEPRAGDHAAAIRDALARLQMAYAQGAAGGRPGQAQAPGEQPAEGTGEAPRSSRLWVPGQ
jgi:hypothetical protein